jgi:hypothetical protein
VLWRAWTVHNKITHDPGPPLLSDSVFFLLNLRDSCFQVKLKEAAGPQKGKQPCSLSDNRAGATHQQTWEPPPAKWIKINVDGSFVESTGAAGVGVIARDHMGNVIFTAWRTLNQCPSPFVAEATACADGLRLASQWPLGSVILETDCSRVVDAMRSKENRSEASFVLREASEHAWLLQE